MAPLPSRTPWQVQRAVVFAIVQREMVSRVGGQWVGAIWTVFEPMIHVALLVTWLGFIRERLMPGVEYPVFLATGLIPFFLFQKLVTRLLDVIDANRGLFAYRQVKPLDAMIGRAIVEILMSLIVYAVTLLVLARLGFHVWPGLPLEVMGVNALVVLLGMSLGITLAVLSHQRPRLRSIVRVSFLPLYISSGVVFPVDKLPPEIIEWLLWNPMLHVVELSRFCFSPQYHPAPGVNPWYPIGCAFGLTALSLALYSVNRQRLLSVA